MSQVKFEVPNISCGHCVHTIEMELGEMEGVKKVSADQETRQVVVEFDTPATEEALKGLLAEINYPVKG